MVSDVVHARHHLKQGVAAMTVKVRSTLPNLLLRPAFRHMPYVIPQSLEVLEMIQTKIIGARGLLISANMPDSRRHGDVDC